MKSNIELIEIEKLVDEKRGISYGVVQPGSNSPNGIPIIRVQNINKGVIDTKELFHISKDIEQKHSRTRLRGNEVLLTLVGSIGKSAVVPDSLKNLNVARAIAVLPVTKVEPYWLHLCLQTKEIQRIMEVWCTTTVQATLNLKDLSKISIPIFPTIERTKIISIIKNLDTKIENIQNQNKVLEQIAQTIFKSWFVDFEDITEFEDSEIGQIPKGWNVEKISDVCKTFGGGTPSTKNHDYWDGSNYWLVPSDLTSLNKIFCVDSKRKITDKGLQNCASQIHPEKSIFMTSRATIGVFCINEIPAATNQGFIVSRPNNPNHLYYIFLNYLNRVDEFLQHANGSTFLEISRSNFRQLPILMPTLKILDGFHKEIKPFFDMLFDNEQIIELLTKIRNILLPKLMSGEIRV